MSPTVSRSVLLLLCLSLALAALPGCRRAAAPVPPTTVEESAEAPLAATPAAQVPPTQAPAAKPVWTAETTVGRVVAEAPSTVRIFELVKIDYCCGGSSSLADAAAEKKIDVNTLLGALAVAGAGPMSTTEILWDTKSVAELIDHIEATHHVFLRRELPRLSKIFATVVRVHGQYHPELAEAQDVFGSLYEELLPHLKHEETAVFPAARKLADGKADPALEQALAQMRTEHDGAGAAIHKLRDLLNDYVPPESACTAYKELLKGLLALEKDTLMHVHLENNVLLPRCLAAR